MSPKSKIDFYFIIMDLNIQLTKYFEKTLSDYFSKEMLNFEAEGLVRLILEGKDIAYILESQTDKINQQQRSQLDNVLKNGKYSAIVSDKKQLELLVQHPNFKKLFKKFQGSLKNVDFLLELSLKIKKGIKIDIETEIQNQEKIKAKEEKAIIQFFKSDQWKDCLKPTVNISGENEDQLQKFKTQLLLLFQQIKFDATNLVNVIIQGQSEQGVLEELQQQMSAKTFKLLKKILISDEVAKIKELITQAKQQSVLPQKDSIRQKISKIFEDRKQPFIDELVDTIRKGNSQETVLTKMEKQMSKCQYKSLLQTLESEDITTIRADIKKEKLTAELTQRLKKFKINPTKLINTIIEQNQADQVKQLDVLGQNMNNNAYNSLKNQVKQFKIKRCLYISEEDKERKTISLHKRQLKAIFLQFKNNLENLIDSIVNDQQEEDVLNQISKTMEKQDFYHLKQMVKSNQVINIKNKCKLVSEIIKKKQALIEYFSQLKENSKIIASLILTGLGQDKIIKAIQSQIDQKQLQYIEGKMNDEQYIQIKQQMKILWAYYDNPNLKEIFRQIADIFIDLKSNERLAKAILFNNNLQGIVQQLLMSQSLEQLEKLYETLNSQELQKILERVSLKLPKIEEKFVIEKKDKRHLFKKGSRIFDIKLDKSFHFSNNEEMFINQKYSILKDDYAIKEHILCIQGRQYDITFLSSQFTILLPEKQTVEKIKQILQSKLGINNELCLQYIKNNEYVLLQDKNILRKYATTNIKVDYYINLIVKVQMKEMDERIKITSSQTISNIQLRIENQIHMKRENQKWSLNGKFLIDTANLTFQKLQIREKSVRIQISQDRSLEYYGFDKIIQIQRSSFRSFYIQDDNQTKLILRQSPFPSYSWSETFRKICLGYIFSGIKKHSRILICLKHIQNIVEQTKEDIKLWKPKTIQEQQYFNETYVIYNIIKSSAVQLRTDIFRCLMTLYPIPLVIFNENGQQMRLFEENYWLTNKAFTIVSFGLSSTMINDKYEEIHGKSTLLNIIFQTDFQDRAKLHRDCKGGISIQYNIYQNNQYYINLIDISNKIQESLIIQIIKASNMVVIHGKKQDEKYIDQWLKQKNINLPVVLFIRDVKNIFNQQGKAERIKYIQANKQNKFFKKYNLVEISQKSLNYHNAQFNQIANSVQIFTRQSYQQERLQNFWKFSDFLGQSCNKSYLRFNEALKELEKTSEDLCLITNYFYEWKNLSYKRDITTQKKNSIMMEQIKQKAKKQGIAQLLKTILEFYQNNSSRVTQIMNKLRMFLTLIRNELFRDFNELYKLLQSASERQKQTEFKNCMDLIINRLENINKLNNNLKTQKIVNCISQFFNIKNKYKTAIDIDQNWKNIFKVISNQFENYIQPKTFSIENFWREVIYMCKFDPDYSIEVNNEPTNLHDTIVNLCKKQINQSQNFEVINGDLLQMPSDFLKKVFENQQNKKIMIVAIFGPQSSGKSTLLNFVLGCDFMSSAGRCTKGIYGTYFEISNKSIPNCEAILVLDTQGLFSNYKNQKFENRDGFDNKLVLFCLQVCDLIIMNTKGDMTRECQEILANAFDSDVIDQKNLPTVYFVLNCNGGQANITQAQQVQKACMEIVKQNPAAKQAVSASNLKGMPMAFNEIPRKTTATEISKYMASKNIPSDVFYKKTNILSGQIFRILGDRGRKSKMGRTLNQAFDDMNLTWATLNRFSILTRHSNRIVKETQLKIQQWIKKNCKNLQQLALQSKKKLNDVQHLKLDQSQKMEVEKINNQIDDLKSEFQSEFQKIEGDNFKVRQCVEVTLSSLNRLFKPIVDDLKRSVLERRYRLQLEQSKKNGLDDILTLVRQIKRDQLSKNEQISPDQKIKKFQQLWNKRINDMRKGLNKDQLADEHYKNMVLEYNAALKAFHSQKTIYRIEQQDGIKKIHNQSVNYLERCIKDKIQQKYKQQTIFVSSNQSPIMNIQKQNGDLTFKYLDMSKYFEKNIQKVYITIKPQDIISALSEQYINSKINQKIKYSEGIKRIAQYLQQDFAHMFGLFIKVQRLQQWVNYFFQKKWYHFDLIFSPQPLSYPNDFRQNVSRNGSKEKERFCILTNKQYLKSKSSYSWETKRQFLKQFKILPVENKSSQFLKIIQKQQCLSSQDGNVEVINKLINKFLPAVIATQYKDDAKLKEQINIQINRALLSDLQKMNIKVEKVDLVNEITKNSIKKNDFILIKKQTYQFRSEKDFKRILDDFGPFWNKNKLKNMYSKKKQLKQSQDLTIGFIYQSIIIIKPTYKSQSILSTYIEKQYQQFLNEVQKSNFKYFIKKQLNHQICFDEIRSYVFSQNLLKADLSSIITNLVKRVNQICVQINKDLQQVSQKLRIDFFIELHSYAFHLLWHISLNQQWKKRENLINQFEETRKHELDQFLDLCSGNPEQENNATSKKFTEQYLSFLNNKISQVKQIKSQQLGLLYNSMYSRMKIQELVDVKLKKETDQQVIKNYFLRPEDYFLIVLKDQVQNIFFSDLKKYSNYDYELIVKQLLNLIHEMMLILPNVNNSSIDQIFKINELDERKNKAFIHLFCELILKQSRDYVSSQNNLEGFTIKEGKRFTISSNCMYALNKQFLKLIQTIPIAITNIRMFCEYLKDQLENVINNKLLNTEISQQDKDEAIKYLKIDVCKQKCPLCKKGCDVDMNLSPYHSQHKCNYGHQIRAIAGMATQKSTSEKGVYIASILRCDNLTPNSKFQFNGISYTWSDFKKEYIHKWDFQTDLNSYKNHKIYEQLWEKAGKKICEHYSNSERKIQYAVYNEESINKQLKSIELIRPAHYIFLLDQSASMGGQTWNRALVSLQDTIKIISNINKDQNQLISLITFDHNAKVVFTGFSPDNYHKDAVAFSGGGTKFGPAFSQALQLMKRFNDKDNILIFISDGEAEYPQRQILEIMNFANNQEIKGFTVKYTSIFISDNPSQRAPILERINQKLKGQHNLINDTAKIKDLLTQIHFEYTEI